MLNDEERGHILAEARANAEKAWKAKEAAQKKKSRNTAMIVCIGCLSASLS